MDRIEVDCQTGEVKTITLTPEEEALALASQAEWESQNTLDARASRGVDEKDRLLFEINFNQENRLRALEGKAAITRAQYRDALIAEWKRINS